MLFSSRVRRFEADYRAAVAPAFGRGLPVTLCTIYNGNLEPERAEIARMALTLFNDVIVRVALERAARLIDLRLVCTAPADFANPIEPSGAGGRKIAQAIAETWSGRTSFRHPADSSDRATRPTQDPADRQSR